MTDFFEIETYGDDGSAGLIRLSGQRPYRIEQGGLLRCCIRSIFEMEKKRHVVAFNGVVPCDICGAPITLKVTDDVRVWYWKGNTERGEVKMVMQLPEVGYPEGDGPWTEQEWLAAVTARFRIDEPKQYGTYVVVGMKQYLFRRDNARHDAKYPWTFVGREVDDGPANDNSYAWDAVCHYGHPRVLRYEDEAVPP